MFKTSYYIFKSIALIFILVMLFSCNTDTQKVRDFLADKNLPIGRATDAFHVYKDSGRVTSKLITPLMLDFSNRENHPYSEFPDGIKIINFENKGADSITITGNYALSYNRTSISEIRGNVVVVNHTENAILETEELYWDKKEQYFISETKFKYQKGNNIVEGVGFESKEDLTKLIAKKTTAQIETTEN